MTARTADIVLGFGLLACAVLVVYVWATLLGLAMPY